MRTSDNKLHLHDGARRGIAATEFAMVLPVLVTIAFGCIDLCRAVGQYMVVCNAAWVGAETAATHRFTSYSKHVWKDRIYDAVKEDLDGAGYQGTKDFKINISTSHGDEQTGTELKQIRVEVRRDYEPIFDWPGLPEKIRLQHHVHIQQFR